MADRPRDAVGEEFSGEVSGSSEDAEDRVGGRESVESAETEAPGGEAYDDAGSEETTEPSACERDGSEASRAPDEPDESEERDEPPDEPGGPNEREESVEPEQTAESTAGEDSEPEGTKAAAAPDTAPAPAGESDPAARTRRSPGRVGTAVNVFGELLITAGVVLALFVVYSLWWTNIVANRAADRQGEKVRDGWSREDSREEAGARDLKNGVGFLHVPSMTGDDILVTKGTDLDRLNDGVAGYYTKPVKSALPWDQSGNFSVAAHRDGHGAKFHDIDKIDQGDPIVFETKHTWYVYKVYEILPETSRYNVDVLDPVPEESGKEAAGRYVTLTTCTPVYTSEHRYVVWGELVRTQTVDAERTPPKEIR